MLPSETIQHLPLRVQNSSAEFDREEIERSIPERFEKQVAQHSQRIAIKTETETVTYAELNRAANRIARAIRSYPDESEAVALLFGNSTSALSAILGTLKASKFYTALEPTYPRARMEFMLKDSTARVLLTDTLHAPLAKALAAERCHIINVETLDANLPDDNLQLAISPDQLAYLTFTSGSTGTPKGVLHTHRNVLHTIWWETHELGLSYQDRFSLFLSITYGASVANIFSALLNGAQLCPYAPTDNGLARLVEWVKQEQITVLKITPTLFRLLVEHLQPSEALAHLRLITFFGEQLRKRDVELYRRHFPDTCLLRATYSSSETKACRSFLIDKQTPIDGDLIPAGYPIAGVQTLLWDENGKEVGVDEVGEIVVKSCYLSPGYWRRPDMTEKVFLPDPTGGDERLYRTGDLGRIRPDGMLEFLGRKDAQVKIRGYRIETAEIEMTLLEFPGIQQAFVVGLADRAQEEKRLVAYLVPANQVKPAIANLRAFLQQRLPEFMIPTTFVFLNTLPVLANGKVDQRALPAPVRPREGESFVFPRDRFELELAQIWEDVLDAHPIGVNEKFFDLGGHSLLAAQMFAKIETKYGRAFPPRVLYQASTVEQLAVLLRDVGWQPEWSALVPIQPRGDRPPLFYVPPLNAILSFYPIVAQFDSDQPVYGLLAAPLGDHNPFTSIEDEAAFHIRQIKTTQLRGPYYLVGWSYGGKVAFEIAQQLVAQGERVAFLAMLDIGFRLNDFQARFAHYRRRLNYLARLGLLAQMERVANRIRTIGAASRPTPTHDLFAGEVMGNDWKGDKRRSMAYIPRPFPGRVILFRTRDESPHQARDPLKGWGQLAKGGVEVHDIPGDHSSMLFEPYVQELAAKFRASLARAQTYDPKR